MTRAAIYARFSSDLQRDRSIEDQVELCRTYATRNGLTIVKEFADHARSGASILGRDGLLAMMDAARNREFEVIVVEALDRLSRDQEDLPAIYKRLRHVGVEIQAVHDGTADIIQIGIRGLVGALYLQDLSHKVRRGMAGVTRDGRHAGGRAYGYRAVSGAPGELAIVEDEAAIVRRIYEAFAAGEKPRAIAAALNADNIAPPRGTYWAASTLNGNKRRGHGILLNPLYAGEIVWNRVTMVKDPETGKRVSRINAESEWQHAAAPHLQIVPTALFETVRGLVNGRGQVHAWHHRLPRHLLSGLLKCGCCGAGMSVKDRSAGRVRLQCTGAKEGSPCTNRTAVYLDTVELAVIGGLRERLRDRRAIAAYLKAYNSERAALAADTVARRGRAEGRLASNQRELDRAIDLAVKGVLTDHEASERIGGLKREREDLARELAAAGEKPNVVELHPAVIAEYLGAIEALETTLRGDGQIASSALQPVRDLIERVTVTPSGKGQVVARVDGKLDRLIGGNQFPAMKMLGGLVVAEERYRRPPQDVRLPFAFERLADKR